MLCISLAWSPTIFKRQTNPQQDIEEEEEANAAPVDNIRVKSSRNKMTLICSLYKIFMIFVISFVLAYVFHITDDKNPFTAFRRGHDYLSTNQTLYTMFALQIASSFIGYVMCGLACTMNLQKICFVLPLLLATPLSLGVSVTKVCEIFTLEPCHNYKGEDYETLVLGFLLWLSQIFSYSFQFWKSQQFLMAGEELLFWLPTYNGMN